MKKTSIRVLIAALIMLLVSNLIFALAYRCKARVDRAWTESCVIKGLIGGDPRFNGLSAGPTYHGFSWRFFPSFESNIRIHVTLKTYEDENVRALRQILSQREFSFPVDIQTETAK